VGALAAPLELLLVEVGRAQTAIQQRLRVARTLVAAVVVVAVQILQAQAMVVPAAQAAPASS
jgi:hypothetical protein